MTDDTAIEFCNVFSGYDKKRKSVLNSLSCKFEKNKFTAICGLNGSGKSTLLKTLCGINELWGGDIKIFGESLSKMSGKDRAKLVSYVPQQRIVADCSVRDFLLYGRFPYKSFPFSYSKKDLDIVDDVIEKNGLSSLCDLNMNTLSGGQRQKVYIAMALCQNCPIVVLDEPLSFLDMAQQLELLKKLKNLVEHEKKTVIMVCHDLNFALKYCDDILVLDSGKNVFHGNAKTAVSSGIIEKIFNVKLVQAKTCDGEIEFGFRLEDKA